jgi:hypothetical protein
LLLDNVFEQSESEKGEAGALLKNPDRLEIALECLHQVHFGSEQLRSQYRKHRNEEHN